VVCDLSTKHSVTVFVAKVVQLGGVLGKAVN